MTLGKVVGNVWATKKDDKLIGMKLLIVRHVELDYAEKSSFGACMSCSGGELELARC